MKRTQRKGRMLLVAGAGVASLMTPLACGSQRVYGTYCDPGPCGTIALDGGPADAGADGGEDAGGPFGVVVHPDGGDGG